jgi:hypothetical protein
MRCRHWATPRSAGLGGMFSRRGDEVAARQSRNQSFFTEATTDQTDLTDGILFIGRSGN